MKKNDLYTHIQRQRLSTLSIMIPLGVIAILQILNPRNDFVAKALFLVLVVILLIVGIFVILRSRANLKRLEQRRERALQGDSSLLAKEQPLPDPQILPLPITIKLDQSRRAVVFLCLVIALILFIFFVVGVVPGLDNSAHNSGNHVVLLVFVILGGAVVMGLLALAAGFFLIRRQLIFTLVVDERGLSVTYQGGTSTINWSAARLFAVLTPDKPVVMRAYQLPAALRFYELSNEQIVVRWPNVPGPILVRQKENMPSAEYRQKVQALLSLIAARTELPLYDLGS